MFAEHLTAIFTPNEAQADNTLNNINNPRTENITPVTTKDVANEITTNLNPKKAPGYDLIAGKILKQLPRKGIVMLTYLFNAVLRLQHVPASWKLAEVIMLPKPGKPPNDVKLSGLSPCCQSCQKYSKNYSLRNLSRL